MVKGHMHEQLDDGRLFWAMNVLDDFNRDILRPDYHGLLRNL